MAKIKNELKSKLSSNVFNKNFVYIYTNQEAESLMKNANWHFIGDIIDEFAVLIADYGIDDAIDIYRTTYRSELLSEGGCTLSTEVALSLLGTHLSEQLSFENVN
jgi:hypothetical protein